MNTAFAVKHIYPQIQSSDFYVLDNAITEWSHSEPQPLLTELQEAWDEIKASVEAEPLQTRLRAILATQPAAVRAAFLPITAGVNYALEQGDNEAALAAITATEVPEELEPAKAALIAEFEI